MLFAEEVHQQTANEAGQDGRQPLNGLQRESHRPAVRGQRIADDAEHGGAADAVPDADERQGDEDRVFVRPHQQDRQTQQREDVEQRSSPRVKAHGHGAAEVKAERYEAVEGRAVAADEEDFGIEEVACTLE